MAKKKKKLPDVLKVMLPEDFITKLDDIAHQASIQAKKRISRAEIIRSAIQYVYLDGGALRECFKISRRLVRDKEVVRESAL